jgi:hypothetical protein
MANQAFNLLGSIIILAMISVALRRSSNTAGVLGAFWKGFTGAIKGASNA